MTESDSANIGGFAILVLAVAKPGCVAEAATAIAEQLERIRKSEATCLSIAVHVDSAHPDRLMLYELWTDEPSFDVFLAKPFMTEYLDQLDRLLESREITRWETAG